MDLSTVETVGLITEKRKNKAKYLTWNTIRLSLWRNSACRTLPKALDRLSATARVAPDLLKAQTILSGKTARRSFIDWEYLKPYWKSEKRARFSKWSRILWFTSFLKDVTNHSHRKKTNRVVVFNCRTFPNILKYGDHQWNVPTIWKARLLQTFIKEFS